MAGPALSRAHGFVCRQARQTSVRTGRAGPKRSHVVGRWSPVVGKPKLEFVAFVILENQP